MFGLFRKKISPPVGVPFTSSETPRAKPVYYTRFCVTVAFDRKFDVLGDYLKVCGNYVCIYADGDCVAAFLDPVSVVQEGISRKIVNGAVPEKKDGEE